MDVMGKTTITTAAGSADIAVAGAVTVYTKAVYVGLSKFHALSYKANSATAGVDVKIEVQQAFMLTDALLAAAEGVDSAYFSEPENMADVVASLTVENTWYHKSLALIPLPLFRLKITGAAGNGADCIVNAVLSKQENA